MKINHHHEPWTHITVDDFLTPSEWNSLQQLASDELRIFKSEGGNTPRGKYIKFYNYDLFPDSNKFFDLLPKTRSHGTLKKINHIAIQPPGNTYPVHIDNRSRINTAILYFSPEKSNGTILHKNSSPMVHDHGQPELSSEYTRDVEWKPNRLFVHNSIDGVTWHNYKSTDDIRITFQSFLVDPNLISKSRQDLDFLIDI
jgi:hypothetical protein